MHLLFKTQVQTNDEPQTMKSNTISLLHKHILRFRTHFQCRNITSAKPPQSCHLVSELTVSSIHSISTNPCLAFLGLCKTSSTLQKMHALFIIQGEAKHPLLRTKLISLYGLFGRVRYARLLFDEIPYPDIGNCKVMIRWYFLNDLYEETLDFYRCMRKRFVVSDNVVFSIVLNACRELRDLDEGRKLHCHVTKVGGPDSFVLTGLVDVYAKCGEIESSRIVFDGIEDRNVVCWTSMIVAYAQNDCAEEALILFNRLRDGLVEGNQFTFGSVVTACAKLGALHQGRWVHGYVIKNGVELNAHLITAFVDMYIKCGVIRDARSIFDEICVLDVVLWTTMIAGYTQGGYLDEALKLFKEKSRDGIIPNSATITSVLSTCAQLANWKFGTSVHSIGTKLGLEDGGVTNALIDMYAKCHMIGDARYIFDQVQGKDVVTWNTIISGYSLNGFRYGAVVLFHRMRLESIKPDAVTVVAVISACASFGAFRFGSSLHALSVKEGFLMSSVHVGTALLNLYAKSGDVKSARSIFDGMVKKNTVTWNSMIGGYGMQGDCSNSLELFNDMMKQENLGPNNIIFTAILSACSHAGVTGEGWRLFNQICNEYHFVPSMQHYVCIIDLLARSGKLDEALEFIERMPIQPDVSAFGAFLNGCGIHSRIDLGEVAVRKIFELDPQDASYYILASNFFASHARWSRVYEVRELMKMRGLRKSSGCSQVDNFDTNFYPQKMVALC